MKYFFDTEFIEDGKTIDLISIGIVVEDGREYYAVSREFDFVKACSNEWVKMNVVKPIYEELTGDIDNEDWQMLNGVHRLHWRFGDAVIEKGRTRDQIREDVIEFCGENPEFWAYYADYDWVAFCQLFGRMIDLPKGFPKYCRDLKQRIDEVVERDPLRYSLQILKEHPDYPRQENEHNALADAKWNRDLFGFLCRARD